MIRIFIWWQFILFSMTMHSLFTGTCRSHSQYFNRLYSWGLKVRCQWVKNKQTALLVHNRQFLQHSVPKLKLLSCSSLRVYKLLYMYNEYNITHIIKCTGAFRSLTASSSIDGEFYCLSTVLPLHITYTRR